MNAHSTAAAVLGLVLIGLTATPSLAAPGTGRSTTQVAEAAQVSQAAATTSDSDEESANCNKQRRRLWIEGEGWIVRRVTICR